ncbi:hypothetical protein [Actinomadura litoris]|uniref:hypothetical protein n=1 Tax=Actinomadura litoris TaxID=2678616 RepID=UPI001FA70A1B|nr:hypothetical protein [Actinomadura litoris]
MVMPQQPAPRKAVQRRKMGFLLHGFHLTMCFCTVGLWTPVYLSGLRKRKTVIRYR